jgi:uncharacterized protein YceK
MKSLCLVLLLALGMPGCSTFSKSSRQQRAYNKYIQKMSSGRRRQQTKAIKQRSKMPELRSLPPVQENIQREGE